MVAFNDETIFKLFGREDAENESPERLKEFFFRNKAYENLTANLPIRILVGHKGTGKSALLKVAYEEDNAAGVLALWLRPDDVRNASPNIASGDLNARIEAWKSALTKIIAREISERTGIEMASASAPSEIRERVLDLVKFVREAFSSKIDKGIDSVKLSIVRKFMETEIIRVYLDDLDRGWKGKADDIENISALINAIRDLCGHRNTLQFRVGLRSDVYYLVRTSDESTDKIEGNIIFLTWDSHDVLVVAAKRVESYFGRHIDEAVLSKLPQAEIARLLHSVMAPRFLGAGKWENVPIHRVLLSLVRKRPRDLVKLLSGAAKEAFKNGNEIITTDDLKGTFEAYSNERLQDIVNEFKTELPEISNLLRGMRPLKKERSAASQFTYTNDQLSKKIKKLMEQNRFVFANGERGNVHSIGQFLYKIDFIMARKENSDGTVVRKFFDQNRYLQDQFVDFGFDWEVHPAYRWALQPTDVLDLMRNTALDSD